LGGVKNTNSQVWKLLLKQFIEKKEKRHKPRFFEKLALEGG